MKLFLLIISIIVLNNVNAQKINVLKEKPDWAANSFDICKGDYTTDILNNNKSIQLIACGFNEYQKPTKKVPTKSIRFLYVNIDGVEKYLTLKSINKTKKGSVITTYENDIYKIELNYDGVKRSSSGNGNGGFLKFYKDKVLIKKMKFYSTI